MVNKAVPILGVFNYENIAGKGLFPEDFLIQYNNLYYEFSIKRDVESKKYGFYFRLVNTNQFNRLSIIDEKELNGIEVAVLNALNQGKNSVDLSDISLPIFFDEKTLVGVVPNDN